MKTKIITLFLMLEASVGMMHAEIIERVQIGDLYYNLNDDSKTAEVTSRVDKPWINRSNYSIMTSISIPNELTYEGNNYSVTSIGEWAFYLSWWTSVDIPNSVTSIGDNAFSDSKKLTSVIIPNSVTSIGSYAFSGCSGLTSVNIPNSVASIGNYAFSRCLNITSFVLGNSISNIGGHAFYECSNLTSINIPNSVTSIGENAFHECSSLTSVHISDLTAWCNIDFISITSNPLYYALNLYLNGNLVTDVIIPDSFTSIRNYVFSGCSSLTSVTIPNSVTNIGDRAFYNCSSLTSIEIPNSVTSIEGYTFCNCSSLTSVIIGNSVTSIGDCAFLNCYEIKNINIPYSVEEFSPTAFSGCNKISSVTINSDVVAGRNYQEGNNMSHVFGEQVKEYIFGDSVSSIGSYAFYKCKNVDSFTFGKNMTNIGEYAFYGAGKYCRSLDPLYEEFVLPENLQNIGQYAFFCWFGLTSLTLPNSVQSIGKAAFGGCHNLAYLSLPASLNNISGEAFFGCSGLKSVTNWATTPPSMGGNENNPNYQVVFCGVDCDKVSLFVPKESIEEYKTAYQWEEFTHIYPIEYAEGISTSEIKATANEDNSVTVEWSIVEDAVIYIIEIKKNGELVCSLEFNEEGQLISKVFAMSSRDGNRQTKSATQTANGWKYTIDGLDPGTEYTYTITAKKADDTEAFTQTITFSTISYEGIENIETSGGNMTKIIHNGQILILRGDKTYTMTGQEVR